MKKKLAIVVTMALLVLGVSVTPAYAMQSNKADIIEYDPLNNPWINGQQVGYAQGVPPASIVNNVDDWKR